MKKILVLLSFLFAFTLCKSQSYLSYTFLLNQHDTLAPVPIVLQNSIGDIEWVRLSKGTYRCILPNGFPVHKTFYIYSHMPYDDSSGRLYVFKDETQDDYIEFTTSNDIDFAGSDDSMLVNTPIEIRVYP